MGHTFDASSRSNVARAAGIPMSGPCQNSIRFLQEYGKVSAHSLSRYGDVHTMGGADAQKGQGLGGGTAPYSGGSRRSALLCSGRGVRGEAPAPTRRAWGCARAVPGMFALRETWRVLRPDARERFAIRSYARIDPDAVFCGVSAALMHGLPVSYTQLGQLQIYAVPGRKPLVTQHIARRRPSATTVEERDGVCVVCMEQAVVESLCSCAFEDALAIADGFLRRSKARRSPQTCRLSAGRRFTRSGTRRRLTRLA